MLSINPNNATNQEESIKNKFQGLPKGTKILKATEDEVILELDDSAHIKEADFIKLKPEDHLTEKGPVLENKDESDKDIVLYLDSPINTKTSSENPEMFILHQNFENTVEVVARTDSDYQSKNDIKRRPKQPGKFPCPMNGCRKSFVAKHSVNMHVKNVHLAHSVSCHKCGKSYSNPDNLKVRPNSVLID